MHYTSGIGQGAIGENWLLDDAVYGRLRQLGANVLAHGFWTKEDRPFPGWAGFIEVLERMQREAPDTKILAYIGSPAYAGTENFVWNSGEGEYNDYERWAEEVATLSLTYPNLIGITLDDFNSDAQLDDHASKIFTPGYMEDIKAAGVAINPEFKMAAVVYIPGMSVNTVKRFENSLDIIHFFYRHYPSEDAVDTNPGRIRDEITMSSRCCRSDIPSQLASIQRISTLSAVAGNFASVQATINLGDVVGDLVICYFENTRLNIPDQGYVVKKISFAGELLVNEDIAISDTVGEMDVKKVTVTAATIAELLEDGPTATLELKLEVIQAYSSWSYTANIYVEQPDLTVEWTGTDATNKHIVYFSNSLTASKEINISVYGRDASFFGVDAAYTEIILPICQERYLAGEVDGISIWEAVLPTDLDVYELYIQFSNSIVGA